MKNYAISMRISVVGVVASLILAFLSFYVLCARKSDFWCDFFMAIFGSGLFVMITSVIGYFVERIKTLENFNYATRSLLKVLKNYDASWNIEEKIKFFILYSDVDKSQWDALLGSIYFVSFWKKDFKYIYQKVYKPIAELNVLIADHYYHFLSHMPGKTDSVMMNFIVQIEEQLIVKTNNIIESDDGTECQIEAIYNGVVTSVLNELEGKYYDIMYKYKKKAKNNM